MRRMDPLTTVTIMMTVIVTVFVFLFVNVGLALTNHGEFVVWRVSSRRIVQLPAWTFGAINLAFLASLGILVLLWSTVAVKSWKRRGASTDRHY